MRAAQAHAMRVWAAMLLAALWRLPLRFSGVAGTLARHRVAPDPSRPRGHRAAGVPRLLRLRGGGGETNLAHLGDFVVPKPYATLQDAAAAAKKKGAAEGASILVRTGGGPETYKWGVPGAEHKVLDITGWVRIRAADMVDLTGPIVLNHTSRGEFQRVTWGTERMAYLQLRAGMSVAGGPWELKSCVLRGANIPVVCVYGKGEVSLAECFVGGYGVGMMDHGMLPASATDGIFAMEEASVSAVDCSFQHCGMWGSAALRAMGSSNCALLRCFFFQNQYVHVSVHHRADVKLVECSFLQHGLAAFMATLALEAALTLDQVTVDGTMWANNGRPGTVREDGVSVVRRRQPKRQLAGGDPLEELYAYVDSHAADICSDWEDASKEMTTALQVLEHLEFLVASAGGTTQRVETGRQKLAQRISGEFDAKAMANMAKELGIHDFSEPDGAREMDDDGVQISGGKPDGAGKGAVAAGPLTRFRMEGVGREQGDEEYETLPPLLLASFPDTEKAAKTLCVYVHVEPLLLSALRDPSAIADGDAVLIENSDRYLSKRTFGGDSARALAWIMAVNTMRKLAPKTHINVKIIFDFLEESHQGILSKRLEKLGANDGFLSDCDFVVVCGGSWLTLNKPALVCGYRGLTTIFASVQTSDEFRHDFHSGTYGGAIREPFSDLVRLLASLKHPDGSVAVEGLEPQREISPVDMGFLENVELDVSSYAQSLLGKDQGSLAASTKAEILANLWLRPSISIHGINGGWNEQGVLTILPHKVVGKFSVRTPPQGIEPDDVVALVEKHLSTVMGELGSPNILTVSKHYGCHGWVADPASDVFDAASRAIERVHGNPPEVIMDGASMPVADFLARASRGKSVVVMPLGYADMEALPDDLFYRAQDFLLCGIKVAAAMIDEVAAWSLPEKTRF